MEPTEIQEFSNQLKEAGEGRKEESLTSISLAISILAVLVAMVTVLGHRTHTEAVLMEARASDQWNLYQAKKIRQDNLAVVVETLALNTPSTPAIQQKIADFKTRIAKWTHDLEEEQAKAREFEAEVSGAERRASRYDLGEALLQIAVVLCSVTLFTRNRAYFVFGLSLGVIGLIIAATALTVH
jgi:septal ring factor EnvC (AmiA/AmiB activator)